MEERLVFELKKAPKHPPPQKTQKEAAAVSRSLQLKKHKLHGCGRGASTSKFVPNPRKLLKIYSGCVNSELCGKIEILALEDAAAVIASVPTVNKSDASSMSAPGLVMSQPHLIRRYALTNYS